MISKEERYRRLIQLFEYENPALRIKKELGRGQHGVAFELEDGNVIKFTIDKRELRVCEAILGTTNRHICNIFQIGKLSRTIDDYSYTWIVQERLYENKILMPTSQAVTDFRHAWFWLYSTNQNHRLHEGSLWDIYNRKDVPVIHCARRLLEQYIMNINNDEYQYNILTDEEIGQRLSSSLMFFDFIQEAYQELFEICPFGRIDLNDGNFLFDRYGHLKTFDILTIDE